MRDATPARSALRVSQNVCYAVHAMLRYSLCTSSSADMTWLAAGHIVVRNFAPKATESSA